MFSADLLTYWRVLPVYLFVLALAGDSGLGAGGARHVRSLSGSV
jgi:hypothetical protein